MKILLIIPTLGAGGAERVASTLCNHWAQSGNDVIILKFDHPGEPQHYKPDPAVKVFSLDLLSKNHTLLNIIKENLRRVIKIRRAILDSDPDIIISFMTTTNILSIAASRMIAVPLIISERVHPGAHDMGRLRSLMRTLIYRYADGIVVQTNGIANWVSDNLNIKSTVIPNPIKLEYFKRKKVRALHDSRIPEQQKQIVSVGRLDRQKGHDITIAAFANISHKYPDWSLLIYGEGVEQDRLESLIRSLNLEGRVSLMGVVRNIRPVLDRADIFVLSSRYEGFPNVLVEALAYQCCVISSDCHGASNEILQNGLYGKLVEPENIQQLTTAIEELIDNETLRWDYENRARDAVTGFSLENVSKQWMTLMSSVQSDRKVE